MIIARGSDSSFSMHSWTMRRATRFVEETRGMSASDSSAVRRSTILRVSRWIIACPPPHNSLILQQLLDPRAQLTLAHPRLFDHRGRGVAHELLVGQARVHTFQLPAALLDLALRALDLLLRHHPRRELDGDGETLLHIVMRPFRASRLMTTSV